MTDPECTEFLQWALPRLRMRWRGFRKVRGQVRKRLTRRLGELGLDGLSAYRARLADCPEEWPVLDSICRITISRFYRDRSLFDRLSSHVLPGLARKASRDGATEIRCWSAGCASGEEPYTINLLWQLAVKPQLTSEISFGVVATEADPRLLERARNGVYPSGSLKDMPRGLVDAAFEPTGAGFALRDRFKTNVRFAAQDIRESQPGGMFDLVLCRNLVFTYYDDALQMDVLAKINRRIAAGGYLIVGIHESIPGGFADLVPPGIAPGVYEKRGRADRSSKEGTI